MAEEKKSNKGLVIVIIILVVVIVAGGGVAAGFFIMGKKASTTVNNTNTNQQLNNTNGVAAQVSSITFPLDEFLVNLSDEGGKRYIKAKILLGYENKKLTKELTTKKPIIRDAINSILRSKKTTDFTEKGTEDIKKELLNRINPMLKDGKADNIYFDDILLQ